MTPQRILLYSLLVLGLWHPSPASGQGVWEEVPNANEPTARHESAFVKLGDAFYLLGGRGIKPIEIYDPETGRWRQGAAPPFQMHHFQAVPYGGKIYVVGAWTEGFPREKGLSHVWTYDPEADAWEQGREIPVSRRRGAAGAAVYDGKIYVAGGNAGGHGPHATAVGWLDVFDPETGAWASLPPAPHGRDHFQAAVVGDRLYLAGGRDSGLENFADSTVAPVDVYDFRTRRWHTLEDAPIPTERAGTTAVPVGDEIVVIGGEGFGQAWDATEALDTRTGTWRRLAPLNRPRHGTQALVHDGKIYIVAGAGAQGGSPELTNMEAYRF